MRSDISIVNDSTAASVWSPPFFVSMVAVIAILFGAVAWSHHHRKPVPPRFYGDVGGHTAAQGNDLRFSSVFFSCVSGAEHGLYVTLDDAIEACRRGGTVYVPPGVHYIASTVPLKKGQTLRGPPEGSATFRSMMKDSAPMLRLDSYDVGALHPRYLVRA